MKCKTCEKELLEPRYKYDDGYCRDCYHKRRRKNGLVQEGDRCIRCKAKIENKPVWKDNKHTEMVGRTIKCSGCDHTYRELGDDKDVYPIGEAQTKYVRGN